MSTLAQMFDKWRAETLEEGLLNGYRDILFRLLTIKFGPLNPEIRLLVETANKECLLEWSERVLTANSVSDVFGIWP